MMVAEFYNTARGKLAEIGGEDGTTFWFHPADWFNLMEGLGPPLAVRQAQRDAWLNDAKPSGWPYYGDGADVGRLQFCRCHVHSEVPAGTVQIRRGEQQLEIPVGPFPPAVEPEGGWDKPLLLPNREQS